jgi:hypothetical protein
VAEPGLVVYQNTAASTSQAVQTAADGATRFLSILNGPNAPTEFRYDLSLPSGAVIEPQTDGSLIVWGRVDLDGGKSPLARIAAPWAYDAQRKAFPASFTVDGHAVVLHVNHAGATYPVVADPELFFFHYYSPSSPYAEGGSLYGNSVGKFTSQVNYADMSRLTMQWGFQLSFTQRNACSYHKAAEFARAAVFKRMTRYQDGHPNTSCDYQFHSHLSKYTYADDVVFPTTHYLRGRIGMPLSLWISVQFQIGPRSVRQINVYADYVL